MSKTFHITEIVPSKWIETRGYYPISFILISKAEDLLILFIVTETRRGQKTRVSFSSLSFFFSSAESTYFYSCGRYSEFQQKTFFMHYPNIAISFAKFFGRKYHQMLT